MISKADRLVVERGRSYLGKAKVRLNNLTDEADTLHGTRELNLQNVARLCKIFELEGCARLEPEHHIPVLINVDKFGDFLRTSKIGHQEPGILPFLELAPETRLTYLHGKHRLEAAKHYFEPAEKWWVVDLYADTLDTSAQAALREEYCNSTNFSDGEIYRYLRHCERNGDGEGYRKWMARLSASKRADILKLKKQASKYNAMAKFRDTLDDLLPFRGLWSAFHIGTFHRLLTLRCPEEMICYLKLVRDTWQLIVGGDQTLALSLDPHTVEILQGSAMAYSSKDEHVLRLAWERGRICPGMQDHGQRMELWNRICSVRWRIPSLHTFLEDTKYLEPCAKILKTLLPPNFKGSIQHALGKTHSGSQSILIEKDSEAGWQQFHSDLNLVKTVAYRQLWLYAMRHFPELTGVQPRKDPRCPKPFIQGGDISLWHRLGMVAFRGGFETQQIRDYVEQNPDHKMALDFLQHARPSEIYKHDQAKVRAGVLQICEALLGFEPQKLLLQEPILSSDAHSLDLANRCGRPFNQSHLDDKQYLFYDCFYHKAWSEQHRKQHPSPLAMKREVFHAFFGKDQIMDIVVSDISWNADVAFEVELDLHPPNIGPPPLNHTADSYQSAHVENLPAPQSILQIPLQLALQPTLPPLPNNLVRNHLGWRNDPYPCERDEAFNIISEFGATTFESQPFLVYDYDTGKLLVLPVSEKERLYQEYHRPFWVIQDGCFRTLAASDVFDGAASNGYIIVICADHLLQNVVPPLNPNASGYIGRLYAEEI